MKSINMYVVLLFVMVIWGLNIPAVKYLTMHAPPVTMTAMRILLAAIVVFIILFFMGIVRKLQKKEWLYVVGGALLNVVLHHALMSTGTSLTTAANTAIIIGFGPILTAVIGLFLLKNRPTKTQWFGFIIGLFGVLVAVILGGGEISAISSGDVLVFLSISSQVFSFMIISKASKTLDPRLLTAYMLLLGAIILGITSLIIEPGGFAAIPWGKMEFWLVIVASGTFGTAIGHMLYNYSIAIVGTDKSAIFINLNTFFGIIGSAILLGEKVGSAHFIALILIVLGVLFGSGTVEQLLKKKKGTV